MLKNAIFPIKLLFYELQKDNRLIVTLITPSIGLIKQISD